jgi:hypothetical protein
MSHLSLPTTTNAALLDLERKLGSSPKAYKLFLRHILEEDFYAFIRHLGYDLVDWEVHYNIIRVLESEARRKLVVVPRGCFKSTLVTVCYPIWRHLKDPNLRILIDSELMENSVRFLAEIQDHLQSEKLYSLYGPLKHSKRRWTQKQLDTALRTKMKKECNFTCTGLGAEKTSQHYDVACLDDMSTPRNTETPEQRAKVINHYRYYTSLLDQKHGELVVVGTRYHEEDLIGWIIENELDEDQRKAIGF